MEQTKQYPATAGRVPSVRIAVATMALFTLSATVMAPVAAHATTKSVVVSTAKSSKFGTILVSGRTLYTLKSNATACGSSCFKYWPPLLLPKGVTKATAGTGVNAAKLGTKRSNGKLQVTYAGKALYYFFHDTAKGQVKGNLTDEWGKWSDVVIKKAGG